MARINLTRHWKFRRLARALGSAALARGTLELLWEAGYEAVNAYIGTPEDIADAVAWPDDPAQLVELLAECGFLESPAPGQYVIHDLWHHAPKYVQQRWSRAHPEQAPPWKSQPYVTRSTSVAEIGTYPSLPFPTREEEQAAAPLSHPVEKSDQPERAICEDRIEPERRLAEIPSAVLLRAGFAVREGLPADATEVDLKEDLKCTLARASLPFDSLTINAVLDVVTRIKPLPAQLPPRQPERRRFVR